MAPLISADAGETGGASSNAMRRALARARDGKSLDLTEATVLLGARGEQLTAVMASAAAVRDAGLLQLGRPGTVTYSRKVFIPLTRLCRDRCHYCTFATVAAPKLPAEFLSAPTRCSTSPGQGAAARLQGGAVHPRRPPGGPLAAGAGVARRGTATTTTLSYVRAMARSRVLEETGLLPHLNPGVMSWAGHPAAQAGRSVAWG